MRSKKGRIRSYAAVELLEARALLASISGTVYADINLNATLDVSEPKLAGWTIYIDANGNRVLDAGEVSTQSGPDGRYAFTDLAAGGYRVRELVRTGWKPYSPAAPFHDVTVNSSSAAAGIDFGNLSLLGRSFNNFDLAAGNAAASSGPPESAGAVGAGQLVSLNDSFMVVQNRAGRIRRTQALDEFFAPLTPTGALSDVRIIFDSSHRFFISAIESSGGTSHILLAASRTSSALARWQFHSMDLQEPAQHLRMAAGGAALYITADATDVQPPRGEGEPARTEHLLVIIRKLTLLGRLPDVHVYEPDVVSDHPTGAASFTPASMFGPGPGDVTMFLVGAIQSDGQGDEQLPVISIRHPLRNPIFSAQTIDLGDISSTLTPPPAPQPGTAATITTGDSAPINAVWRQGNLYTAITITPPSGPDSGQATAHWLRLRRAGSHLRLAGQGNIGGEDIAPGTSTFLPSVAVDRDSFLAVGFSASGPDVYPGAYAAGRVTSDPPGSVRGSLPIARGQDIYSRGGASNSTWATYSTTIVDRGNPNRFWVLSAFTLPADPDSGEGMWGQRWASFNLPAKVFAIH